MARTQLLDFPEIVDEINARLVAAGVVSLCLATLLTQQRWLVVVLAAGFVLRVMNGPRLSPLAQFATKVVRPRLSVPERLTAGTPKRFAQSIGATLSLSAAIAGYGFNNWSVAWAMVAAILVAASLEAALGYCLGCKIFALLIRGGVLPEDVCKDCADISERLNALIDQQPAEASKDFAAA